jgi:hypothetical protein
LRQLWQFTLSGVVPMSRLDDFDRKQQHPQPALPQYSGSSELWRGEHAAGIDGFGRGAENVA